MENRNSTELEDKVIELERCIVMLTGLVERASDNGSRHEMPFYMKHLLSIDEAAAYFSLGENKLRTLIKNNPDADYLLHSGKIVKIKRQMFADYLDRTNYI